jgi:WD40 repeat protein
MTESATSAAGRVFISYRRQDTGTLANWLADYLASRIGSSRVIMDVDSIEPGADFAEVIEQAVGSSDVLLALIGPDWLTLSDYTGDRRIDNPDDIVRLELETALRRDLRVIPVLVEGARMPSRSDLPESLSSLARRNAIELRPGSLSEDGGRLAVALETVRGIRVSPEPPAAESASGLAFLGRYRVLSHKAEVNALAFSPDSRLLATGSADRIAVIWDVATSQRMIEMEHTSQVGSVAFSPDGRRLATGSADNAISLWEAATGRSLITFQRGRTARSQADASVDAVAFSPDGRLLASGSADGLVGLWDAATGAERLQIDHRNSVFSVAFSPDGRWFGSGSADGTARVWDAATGAERLRMTHLSSVFSVAFSPDGRWFASGSADGTARIWNVGTGAERLQIAHRNSVLSVGFSPDGRWLATGSYDGSATIWEAATGRRQARSTHDDRVTSVAFSPDGSRWATASYDDTARIFLLG